MYIKNNIDKIYERVNSIISKKGLSLDDITIVAVTKTVDVDRINEAISYGISDIGENKVQEIQCKYEKIVPNTKWHMIGHLQSNKVKYIIDKVHLIHSLDRVSLAKEIQKRAEEHDICVDTLVQVNIAEEDSKFGLRKEEVIPFIETIKDFNRIRVKGLMTIAPYVENPEEVRFVFRDLKNMFEDIKEFKFSNVDMKYLSMGMTNDFEVALEEGANMIRIGTGIFGKRTYKED
ncbi:YggS family pyridoxal phosphate-dependent enzyme [Proteiniborus sp. DW1]|uniref:YggS family pyridoxal phosphate-dependent enzyme n=1 Tax=Proteiniborus sp. DW1 TaxID=1889883 RepID=UPI0009428FF6|nr:YggS family pyridoxal phosphate-dependent enzyme [Proteiniborus sp. DW1]